jgi:hypothetical protein
VRLIVPLMLLISACAPSAAEVSEVASPDPIQISMSLYVLDDADGGPNSPLSSQRQVSELEEIAQRMNEIWGQAGVELVVETVARVDVSADVLNDLAAGDTSSFLRTASDGGISVPAPGVINGFYVRQIGTANGVAPFRARVFFVSDEPTVHDERVSSHEVGHILGLHHDLEDSGRLMYSGTNGMELTNEQITAARYAATGILDGIR